MTADRPAGARSGHRILIVDDHEPTVRMLADVVRHWSGADVRTTTDSRRVLSMFRDFEPDMLLLDLHMPGLDGVDLIRQVTTRLPDGEYLPIVVFSGDTSADARRSALATGASDFIAKPIVVPEVTLRLGNLLRLRDLTCRLEAEVRARTRDLEAAELDVANRLARVAEYRDYPDGAHVQRVGRLSALIAARLDRPETEVALLRFAAPLHDIGKVAIPDALILKPARLTPAEMEVIRSHTTIGARTLAGSRSPIL